MEGHGDNIISSEIIKREGISMRALAARKTDSSKNDNDPATPSVLDVFLNDDDPSSVTIEALFPSPDKTTSGMSRLTSPDLVSLFPGPDKYPETKQLKRSPASDIIKESYDDVCTHSQNLLWIKIESSNVQVSSSFCIPVSVMLQREVEMQAAARENRIGKERWTSSRIFRMWKSQCARQKRREQHQLVVENESKKDEMNNFDSPGEIFLRMTPEVSLQNLNSSCRLFRWKPWLTTCISSYYNTGNLRIPNECSGDDILLTLEYFGILTTSPDNFVFDSTHAYVRTQAWSRYFMHRADLAESLLDSYDEVEMREGDQNERKPSNRSTSHSRPTLVWILLKEEEYATKDQFHAVEQGISFAKPRSVKSLHRSREPTRRLQVKGDGGLYNLLFGSTTTARLDKNEEETKANILSEETSLRMREDFSQHLRQSLPPWITVRFDIERVEVTPMYSSKKQYTEPVTERRPVIRIYHNQRQSTASILEMEGKLSVTSHLMSEQELGCNGVVTWNHPSGSRDVQTYRSTKKASGLCDLDKIDDIYFDGNKSNTMEETRSQSRNHDIGSNVTFITVDAISKLKSVEKENFNKTQQFHKPITYVNTEFGDLRSVTSVLSEPKIDDKRKLKEIHTSRNGADKKRFQDGCTVLATAKQIVRKRSEREIQKKKAIERKRLELSSFSPSETPRADFCQKIETPPRTTRNLRNTPPWDLGRAMNDVEDEEYHRNCKMANKRVVSHETSIAKPLENEVKSIAESDASESNDDNSETKSVTEPNDSHGSWGYILASMCEAIIPAPSSNILSSSPIRNFQLSSNKSTSVVALTDDENQPYTSNEKSRMEAKANGIVDQVKRMGNDLSNQFDELMKIAYNEEHHEGFHLDRQKSFSPMIQEIPAVLSIDANEDLTLASCLTSSIIGQPQNNQIPEENEKRRKLNSRTLSNKIPAKMAYNIPRSKSFESDLLHRKSMKLPERVTDKRLSTRDKAKFERKKVTARHFSDRKGISKSQRNSPKTNRFPSVQKIMTGYSANGYSKESCYSRHEEIFYS